MTCTTCEHATDYLGGVVSCDLIGCRGKPCSKRYVKAMAKHAYPRGCPMAESQQVVTFRERIFQCKHCPRLRTDDGRLYCRDRPAELHDYCWRPDAECVADVPRWAQLFIPE